MAGGRTRPATGASSSTRPSSLRTAACWRTGARSRPASMNRRQVRHARASLSDSPPPRVIGEDRSPPRRRRGGARPAPEALLPPPPLVLGPSSKPPATSPSSTSSASPRQSSSSSANPSGRSAAAAAAAAASRPSALATATRRERARCEARRGTPVAPPVAGVGAAPAAAASRPCDGGLAHGSRRCSAGVSARGSAVEGDRTGSPTAAARPRLAPSRAVAGKCGGGENARPVGDGSPADGDEGSRSRGWRGGGLGDSRSVTRRSAAGPPPAAAAAAATVTTAASRNRSRSRCRLAKRPVASASAPSAGDTTSIASADGAAGDQPYAECDKALCGDRPSLSAAAASRRRRRWRTEPAGSATGAAVTSRLGQRPASRFARDVSASVAGQESDAPALASTAAVRSGGGGGGGGGGESYSSPTPG